MGTSNRLQLWMEHCINAVKSRISGFNLLTGESGISHTGEPGAARDWLIPCALMLQGVLTLSPLLHLAGIRGMYIYALVYGITLYSLIYGRRTIPVTGVILAAGVVLGSCLTSLYWHDYRIAVLPCFFIGSILLAGVADRDDIDRFINLCTVFLMIMLVLSWIGFLYVLHGGQPLFAITNIDGRENVFYLTTFSNWRVLDSIRPSGVFDEPGTFSFLVCAVAALRRIYNRSNTTSMVMLLLGLVTFSMTHIAFLVLFVLLRSDRRFLDNLRVLLVICAGVTFVYFFLLREAIDAALMWKFNFHPETRSFSGDNRSEKVVLATTKLSMRSFLWGLDSTGITAVHKFTEKFGSMTATPMGPLITSGIFVSFPYYFFLIRVAWHGIRCRENHIYLAVVLLFLPRPYVTGFGYAVLAMIFLFSIKKPVAACRRYCSELAGCL
jgi:hypothetical protein